jgi:hypothetical protein
MIEPMRVLENKKRSSENMTFHLSNLSVVSGELRISVSSVITTERCGSVTSLWSSSSVDTAHPPETWHVADEVGPRQGFG